jgi:hypothetical protein
MNRTDAKSRLISRCHVRQAATIAGARTVLIVVWFALMNVSYHPFCDWLFTAWMWFLSDVRFILNESERLFPGLLHDGQGNTVGGLWMVPGLTFVVTFVYVLFWHWYIGVFSRIRGAIKQN